MAEETSVQDQQSSAGVEQSTADQATSTASGVQDDAARDSNQDADVDTTEESESIELLGQEQFDRLKNDPIALRKELNRAATQKFQEIARYKKVLRPYVNLISGLDSDPVNTVAQLAQQMGLTVAKAQPKTEQETQQVATDIGQQITDHVKEALGPEYEDFAARLGPALHQVAQLVAQKTTEPLINRQNELIMETAVRESKSALDSLGKRHPDWKRYEDRMTQISQRLLPNGMDEHEYLDTLYTLASRDGAEGDRTKKIVNRINKSTSSESDGSRAVDQSYVTRTPSKPPTFAEAAAAALRGERLE
jgi:hypothetical protein